MKYTDYDITFSEVPDETSLSFSISSCGNKCPNCHSPWLQTDQGTKLTHNKLEELLEKYQDHITCICFLGGSKEDIEALSSTIKKYKKKIAWYTGNDINIIPNFDYVKVGSYQKERGGLTSRQTNQRFYKINSGIAEDITYMFQ